MTERNQDKQTVPWGQAMGLLAACLATLIGVCSGLEPDIVLLRAAAAGVVVGLLASTITLAWQCCLMPQQDRRSPAAGRASPSRPLGIADAAGNKNITRTRKAE